MKTNEAAATAATRDEKQNASPVMRVAKGNKEEQAREQENPNPPAPKREISLQELKERANIVYLLQDKHSKLIEKKASLERFVVSHDETRAEVRIYDASGAEFRSNSPKTIAKLVEFWKEEFSEAIKQVEDELKKSFSL